MTGGREWSETGKRVCQFGVDMGLMTYVWQPKLYISLVASLIRLLSIHYLAVDMDNYDAIQVRTIPSTPAPRSHTTL